MTSLSLSLSRLVQWFVWASHRVRFVLIEMLFVCLFFLWLARPSEVVTLSADDWVCFVLFFRWGVLHRVLLVVGWCRVLCSSGFLTVNYLILCRVSSLVVECLGVSAPTPKAQSVISGQEQRFHKWLVMVLSKIKTNIQKRETKDQQMAVTKSGK